MEANQFFATDWLEPGWLSAVAHFWTGSLADNEHKHAKLKFCSCSDVHAKILRGENPKLECCKKESGRRYRGDAHVGVLRMFVTKIDASAPEKFRDSGKFT
jgi:hypothetical protein